MLIIVLTGCQQEEQQNGYIYSIYVPSISSTLHQRIVWRWLSLAIHVLRAVICRTWRLRPSPNSKDDEERGSVCIWSLLAGAVRLCTIYGLDWTEMCLKLGLVTILMSRSRGIVALSMLGFAAWLRCIATLTRLCGRERRHRGIVGTYRVTNQWPSASGKER